MLIVSICERIPTISAGSRTSADAAARDYNHVTDAPRRLKTDNGYPTTIMNMQKKNYHATETTLWNKSIKSTTIRVK